MNDTKSTNATSFPKVPMIFEAWLFGHEVYCESPRLLSFFLASRLSGALGQRRHELLIVGNGINHLNITRAAGHPKKYKGHMKEIILLSCSFVTSNRWVTLNSAAAVLHVITRPTTITRESQQTAVA